MNLFDPVVPINKLHPIFRQLLDPSNAPERAVLEAWVSGFADRDGKFVKEWQTTFESAFWELYLHAVLKSLGMTINFSHASPDFPVIAPVPFSLEAVIAAPAKGTAPSFGMGPPEIPPDLDEFNREAILRLCNSFDAKVRRNRKYYATLPHARDRPFVMAIAPFDRPQAHLAANRAIVAALYGVYYDEESTLATEAENVVRYGIHSVPKRENVDIPVGLFNSDAYKDVSAVVYGPLATWGKLRALADAPQRQSEFVTLHPGPGLYPNMRRTTKRDYQEHLLDGLYVLHNPYAERPLSADVFHHPRIAQFLVQPDGTIALDAPDDFLLMRMVFTTMHEPTELQPVHKGR